MRSSGPTQPELQRAADAAKQRLSAALDRLDTRAKTWAHGAVEASILTGLGLAAGATVWVGVTVIKRRRERARASALRSTALVRVDPRHSDYLVVNTRRAARLVAGLVAGLACAWRLRTGSRTGTLHGSVPRLHASHRTPTRDASPVGVKSR